MGQVFVDNLVVGLGLSFCTRVGQHLAELGDQIQHRLDSRDLVKVSKSYTNLHSRNSHLSASGTAHFS